MSYWYGKKEVTAEDIKWMNEQTEAVDGQIDRRVYYLTDNRSDDGARAVFSSEGVDIEPSASGLSFRWQETWQFANIFYGAKRVYDHMAKTARFEAKQSAAALRQKKPKLELVAALDDTGPAESMSEAKQNRLDRAAERKAAAEQKHQERQAKSAKQRGVE